MGRPKKERLRRRWEVSVKQGDTEIDVIYVRAIDKRLAARIGLLFAADEAEVGTSDLSSEAKEVPTGSLEILPEEYEYLACAQKAGVTVTPEEITGATKL